MVLNAANGCRRVEDVDSDTVSKYSINIIESIQQHPYIVQEHEVPNTCRMYEEATTEKTGESINEEARRAPLCGVYYECCTKKCHPTELAYDECQFNMYFCIVQ